MVFHIGYDFSLYLLPFLTLPDCSAHIIELLLFVIYFHIVSYIFLNFNKSRVCMDTWTEDENTTKTISINIQNQILNKDSFTPSG